jgi:hypothetical protein
VCIQPGMIHVVAIESRQLLRATEAAHDGNHSTGITLS